MARDGSAKEIDRSSLGATDALTAKMRLPSRTVPPLVQRLAAIAIRVAPAGAMKLVDTMPAPPAGSRNVKGLPTAGVKRGNASIAPSGEIGQSGVKVSSAASL